MKIAIVGNGFILGLTQSGAEIDNADIVVRFGNDGGIVPEITGTKTDVVADTEFDYARIKDAKCKKIVLVGDDLNERNTQSLIVKYGYGCEFLGLDNDLERDIRLIAHAKPTQSCAPTSGARIVRYIRNKFPLADITLYGFDWYSMKHPYWYTQKELPYPMQNVKAEETVMRGYCKSRGITIEETIRNPKFQVYEVKKSIVDEVKVEAVKSEPVKQATVTQPLSPTVTSTAKFKTV